MPASMDVDALAARLIAARRNGVRLAALSADEAPRDAVEAYRVQEAMLAGLDIAVAGWKVGAANPTAEPQAGPLLADRVRPSPASFKPLPNALRTVEAELAFSFARDLPARATSYREDEVWDAIDALHVAIEILESSFVDRRTVPEYAPLGDLLNNGGFCYGPAIRDWQRSDVLTPEVVLRVDGKEIRRAGAGTPGGHPQRLLTWLANHAAGRGWPLKRGDIVTTGSHTGVYDVAAGAQVAVRFEDIGEATLQFLT